LLSWREARELLGGEVTRDSHTHGQAICGEVELDDDPATSLARVCNAPHVLYPCVSWPASLEDCDAVGSVVRRATDRLPQRADALARETSEPHHRAVVHLHARHHATS